MPLRTDYTNDILDTSKNTERKYNIKNSNGTIVEENVTFEDVTEYEQEGSRFGASDINATNTKVNELDSNLINSNGESFRFGYQDGKRGYLINEEGADTFYPFKSTDIYISHLVMPSGTIYVAPDQNQYGVEYHTVSIDNTRVTDIPSLEITLNDNTKIYKETLFKTGTYTCPSGKYIKQMFFNNPYRSLQIYDLRFTE